MSVWMTRIPKILYWVIVGLVVVGFVAGCSSDSGAPRQTVAEAWNSEGGGNNHPSTAVSQTDQRYDVVLQLSSPNLASQPCRRIGETFTIEILAKPPAGWTIVDSPLRWSESFWIVGFDAERGEVILADQTQEYRLVQSQPRIKTIGRSFRSPLGRIVEFTGPGDFFVFSSMTESGAVCFHLLSYSTLSYQGPSR